MGAVEAAGEPVRVALHRLQRLLGSRRPWVALTEAAGVSLSQQEMQVLLALRDGPAASIVDVARAAGMDAAAVSRQARVLEERGLLVRRPSAAHGRVVLLEPTPTGRTCARRLHHLRQRHLVDALASWDDAERNELARLLARLVDDLERTPYRRTTAPARSR
jgi:DNA-binding MarR family transcriptional regulator